VAHHSNELFITKYSHQPLRGFQGSSKGTS
jgi:hypothetical protein